MTVETVIKIKGVILFFIFILNETAAIATFEKEPRNRNDSFSENRTAEIRTAIIVINEYAKRKFSNFIIQK